MNVNTNINKIKRIKRNISKSGIALFLLAGFGFLLVTDANAQYRRDNRQMRRVERVENRNINRIAVAQGRSDGLREGANAVRKRNRQNPYGEGKFKKATNGYKSRFGNKEAYKHSYRQGFLRGYDEAYYRNTRRVRINRRNW
jgi:hypothetical protein